MFTKNGPICLVSHWIVLSDNSMPWHEYNELSLVTEYCLRGVNLLIAALIIMHVKLESYSSHMGLFETTSLSFHIIYIFSTFNNSQHNIQ